MKNFIISIAAFLVCLASSGQSIVQGQKAYYDRYRYTQDSDWDKLQKKTTGTMYRKLFSNNQKSSSCALNGRRVYGWHPYWSGSTHNNYQWNLLSDLCYFDYTINPSTGANSNVSFAWSTSPAVTAAKNNGVKISFCATLFSSHSTFLSSTSAKNNFIQNTISLLKSRGGTGVCIDFESMPVSQKTNFVSFMQTLYKKMHDSIPGGEVVLALYAVDWNNVFDISSLKNYADLFIIMGYDYYYGGSTNAGPVDPLYSFETSFNYNVAKTTSYYISQGIPSSKLLLGVPYYGRQYQVAGSAVPSANTGGSANSSSPYYKTIRANAGGTYSPANKKWDANSYSPYYIFQTGGIWSQCFVDDSFSMRKRYDIVNQRSLAGIGIWALGYDDGYNELWNAISDKFSSCALSPCMDSIFDMGGPNRNYNDKESYTYTIGEPSSTYINLAFSQFDLEANYDSLWLYDGPDIYSPVIGGYSGTNLPGSVNSSGNSLTLRFKSDGATNKAGYKAIYSCRTDNTSPTTSITPYNWITGNFTASFNDADVGAGIAHRFYNMEEWNVNGWRANKANGFFNDAFDGTAVHMDWTKQSGTWTINNNTLYQSDEANLNSNIYTSVNQNADEVLYHWTQKLGGAQLNKRAGLHFMCSAPTGNGRGNSYLVYARTDLGGRLQIYESVNDLVFLNADFSYPFMPNIDYDLKVMYNRLSGKITVFVNNICTGYWVDESPLITGNYVCFRSGDCTMNIDNFEILKSRNGNTVPVTVSAAATSDIRTQNTNPSQPGARLKSIVVDGVNLVSPLATQVLNVDFTQPSSVGIVRDGTTANDISTTTFTSQLSANWNTSADPNSGIAKYWYAIGTTSGGINVSGWRENGMSTSVTRAGLILSVGTTYYISVKAENAAGLQSAVTSSNGQKVISPLTSESLVGSVKSEVREYGSALKEFNAYPNPARREINVEYVLNELTDVRLSLHDSYGKEIAIIINDEKQSAGEYLFHYTLPYVLSKGIYTLIIKTGTNIRTFKIVID